MGNMDLLKAVLSNRTLPFWLRPVFLTYPPAHADSYGPMNIVLDTSRCTGSLVMDIINPGP